MLGNAVNLSKTFEPDEDITRTIDYKLILSQDAQLKELDSMKNVIDFLESQSIKSIQTPLQGTCMQVTKDETKAVFTSRSQSKGKSSNDKSKGARVAVIDLKTDEVVLDQSVSSKDLWAVALSNDDQFIYAGGGENIVFKFSISDLTRVEIFEGHTSEINRICISSDDKSMFTASDDGTLRMWDLERKSDSVVLVRSDETLFTLDLSLNDSYLLTGGNQRVLFIYELLSQGDGRVIGKIENNYAIWSCKISQSCSFLAMGDEEGYLRTFKFLTWEETHKFHMFNRISDIGISENEDIIIGGSRNSKINLWYLRSNKEISFTDHKQWVKRCMFIQDDSKIISIGDDKHIKIWKVPEIEHESVFCSFEDSRFLEFWNSFTNESIHGIIQKSSSLFCISWNESAVIEQEFQFSSKVDAVFAVCKLHELIICVNEFEGDLENDELMGNDKDLDIKIVNIDVFNVKNGKKIKTCKVRRNIYLLHIPDSLRFFIIAEPYRLSIIDFNSFGIIQTIYLVSQNALAVVTQKRDEFLFIAEQKQTSFYYFDLKTKHFVQDERNIKILENYVSSANLSLSENSQFLYLITGNYFEVIHCKSFISVFKLNEKVLGLITNINNTLCLHTEMSIMIYSAETFQHLSTIVKDFSISRIVLSKDLNHILITSNSRIIKTENPLNPSKISLIGDKSKLQEFQSYIGTLFDKSADTLNSTSAWLIEPAHVNLLHIYAYMNMYELINDSVSGKLENVPLICSREGVSPLTIALKMNFNDSVRSIIKPLIKRLKESGPDDILTQFLFKIIEDDLSLLNLSSDVSLHKLYKHVYRIDNSSYLPNYCSADLKLPLIVKSQEFFPGDEEFGIIQNDEITKTKAIIFKKSLFRMNFEMGSHKSLDFIESLTKCENFQVFQTELISILLSEKWKKVKLVIFGQALVYLAYLILLCLYTSESSLRTKSFLAAPFAVSLTLYAYEVICIIIDIFGYFKDIWNIVDTFRSWTMIVYSILVWVDYFDLSVKTSNKERFMLAVLIFISWVRGLTYFRIFSTTRYLVKLLFQVFIDIIPFFFIILYSILTFALVFRAFVASPDQGFFQHLTDSYMVIIGNWENPTEVEFYSLILLFATLLNPIITLNLLISILSTTFENVKENQVVADSQELANMILEIETLMFWKRKTNVKSFLHVIDNDVDLGDDATNINLIIKSLKSKVNFINNDFFYHERVLQKFQADIHRYSQHVKEKINYF